MDRRGALEELSGLLADCGAGSGRMALVVGGLASGKTELLQHFYQQAVHTGALVLSATGTPDERTLQTGVIDQLFRGSGLPPDIADRVSRLITPHALSTTGAAVPDTGTDEHTSARVIHEVCAVLLELSRERPVVLGIDDVRFADSSSLQFVLYLHRRMTSTRILVILSDWEQPQPTLPLFHAEVTRRPHSRIQLAPLSEAEITELLGEHVDTATATELAPGWRGLSGGNPMLLGAMIEDLAGGHVAGPGQAGPAFGRAVLACLHRREPGLLEVARAIAVLGENGTPDLVARLAETTPEAADQVVGVLTTAGLLSDGGFRHSGATTAVLDSLPAAERSRLNEQAAHLLYQRGAPATAVATHLLAAAWAVAGWPVAALRVAAEQALMNDDVDSAVRYLELALTATDKDQRLDVIKVLVRALWRVNPAAATAHIEPLREALWAGMLCGRDAATLVSHSLWHGDEVTALRALGELDAVPEPLDAQTAAELRIVRRWFPGLCPKAIAAEVGATAGSDPWVDAARALTSYWTGHCDQEALDSAEHILHSCRPGGMALEVAATALLILMHGNRTERAVWWCERLADAADRSGAVTWQAMIEAISADIALRGGEVVVAAARAESALAMLQPQGWGVTIAYPLSILLLANTALGRSRVVDELMRQQVPEAMFGTVGGLRYLHARGHGHLEAGRALAAISDFESCRSRLRDWAMDLPAFAPWRCDLAEANLLLDRVEVARDLVTEQLRQPALDARTQGVALRVLAAASDLGERPALLRDSVRHLRTAGDRVALARSLTELTNALDALGEHEQATELARTAAEETRTSYSGALPMLTTCAGGGAHETDQTTALSDSERRVAELAAIGHTNREISMRLYITVSTVEQHLTRVYRKLGVKSRAELPRSWPSVRLTPTPRPTGRAVDG